VCECGLMLSDSTETETLPAQLREHQHKNAAILKTNSNIFIFSAVYTAQRRCPELFETEGHCLQYGLIATCGHGRK